MGTNKILSSIHQKQLTKPFLMVCPQVFGKTEQGDLENLAQKAAEL